MILGLTFDNQHDQSALQNPETPVGEDYKTSEKHGPLYHTRHLGSTDNPEGLHTHTKSTPKENKGTASPIPTITIVTDASQTGWRAHLGNANISGSWGEGDARLKHAVLKAVQIALNNLLRNSHSSS